MRVKVVTDGTRAGTRVVDADTGAPLEGVERVRIDLDGDGVRCQLRLIDIPVEVVSGRLKRFELRG